MRLTPITRVLSLGALLAVTPARAEDAPAPAAPVPGAEAPPVPTPRTGWRVARLPLVNFNSGEGFGSGVRRLLLDAGDGSQKPYRHSIVAQFFQTTRGEDLGQGRDSRLEEDARAGLLTGLEGAAPAGTFCTAELTAGLLLDLRDNEPAPMRGMFHELAARGAMEATGSAFRYWGTTLNLRFYHPVLSPRLVAALRLMGEVMGGDVPFFLLNSFGGVEWRDGWGGIGGLFTGRGILPPGIRRKPRAECSTRAACPPG